MTEGKEAIALALTTRTACFLSSHYMGERKVETSPTDDTSTFHTLDLRPKCSRPIPMLGEKRRPLDFHNLFFLVLTDLIYSFNELIGHLLHLIFAPIEIVF